MYLLHENQVICTSELRLISTSGDIKESAKIKLKNRNRLYLADSFLIATTRAINAIILTIDKAIKEVARYITIHIKIK